MNRGVMQTFGKKVGKGIGITLLYSLVLVAILALLILPGVLVPEAYHDVLFNDIPGFCCLSVGIILIPLTIGYKLVNALQESYEECGE